ncbi:hypothetical protein FE782_20850 [Paenibacillus antri]|uniref:Secreted protein n=1 Tax=Paenibacillus antri TaxID=2582848 RepID=A0A5R9G5Z8_9BACL|nr:hypothetical protein [Paenibacillus antri]TLS50469.1 hypothetical protein FE782_20850 [Paenibacillus antri]
MSKKNTLAWALLLSLALGLTACGGDDMRQEMQQERQEDIIDEREDEQLNAPGVEYNQEQREDRVDEIEDDR